MIERLAELHANEGVFSPRLFQIDHSKEITNYLKDIPELLYLYKFFISYKEKYLEVYDSKIHSNKKNLNGCARHTDLPFIGESVIKKGKAKYFFVFEGSLEDTEKLSITVLSCLWLFDNIEQHKSIFNTFWPRNGVKSFSYIYEKLGITSKIATQSYVTDAVRIPTDRSKKGNSSDTKRNRALLLQEIELLNPEKVILVGSRALQIIGNKEIARDSNLRYFPVPFPTKHYRTKEKIKEADQKYKKLSKIY